MSENCTHDCSSCGESCSEREAAQTSFKVDLGAHSSVKKVIGIVSGKGGVGKSLVTSLLAVVMMPKKRTPNGYTGCRHNRPLYPQSLRLDTKGTRTVNSAFIPVVSQSLALDVMSINLLLENDTEPVVWRGPVIAGAVKQFWSDVVWERRGLICLWICLRERATYL